MLTPVHWLCGYLFVSSFTPLQVPGFNQLANNLDQVLRTICTDVAINKDSSPKTTAVGQNITYVVRL
jgi:hypothetical protein